MTMMAPTPVSVAKSAKRDAVPPLENGDRLSRVEFERRYHAMPKVKKAELIEGVVYMGSPVSADGHAKPHVILSHWIGHYARRTPGLIFGDNGTVRLDNENEPQPDLYVGIPAAVGGQTEIDDDDYIAGAPELVAEIAASSASIDLNMKLHVYQRSGVREYIVWRTRDGMLDWFQSVDGVFQPITADDEGVLRSKVVPGLALRPSDLGADDLNAVCELIDASIKTSEHAAFVKNLASASA